ncbi:PKN1 [Mytilus edulis]|uniref:PKN1 n=1 Tax=Mytilus edulis TaxID=6550 RepID=A0A8S3VBH2_MYTED|nr:PKN1 [Mytilus edulis]
MELIPGAPIVSLEKDPDPVRTLPFTSGASQLRLSRPSRVSHTVSRRAEIRVSPVSCRAGFVTVLKNTVVKADKDSRWLIQMKSQRQKLLNHFSVILLLMMKHQRSWRLKVFASSVKIISYVCDPATNSFHGWSSHTCLARKDLLIILVVNLNFCDQGRCQDDPPTSCKDGRQDFNIQQFSSIEKHEREASTSYIKTPCSIRKKLEAAINLDRSLNADAVEDEDLGELRATLESADDNLKTQMLQNETNNLKEDHPKSEMEKDEIIGNLLKKVVSKSTDKIKVCF